MKFKGIVKWEIFLHKKLGHCTKMNEQKKNLGLGPFLDLFEHLNFFPRICNYTADL